MDTWMLPIKQVAALSSGFSHSSRKTQLYEIVQYACSIRSFGRWPKVYSSKETSSMFPRAEDHANGSSMDHPDGEIGEDGHYYKCVICDDGGDLLCCDNCPGVYHLQCLDPPLEHVPAGSWQCQRCCQKDVMVRPAKSLKSWRRPDSSDNTMEELDAAEVLANKMSISRSCDKNLPDKGLETDIILSRRWKGKYFRRSGVKRRRSDKSGLFNSSSTQTGSDKQVDAFLKKDVPCSDRQQEEKAADVDSDGLIDAPQALETVQNVVSRRNHLVDVWSEEELDALWVGVRRYGPGNWQMMLEDPILKFSTSKTPHDLSLRWEIERQWILNSESFQASPYQVSRTRGVLKIYYEARKPSASSSSKTNDSNPAAESEPSLKDWCTKEEGCSEETVSDGGGDGDDKLTD